MAHRLSPKGTCPRKTMPELPEVEVICSQLRARVLGALLERCWVGRADIIREGGRELAWYQSARITDVQRRGKTVILTFSRAGEIRYHLVELGMTGLLLLTLPGPTYIKHTHMTWVLKDASAQELFYWNPRRFGRVHVLNEARLDEVSARRFGFDPLRIRKQAFGRLVRHSRGRIKSLLMDQRKLCGIGNIYANEILFRARIHPHARGESLSGASVDRLLRSMRKVLRAAIMCGGSTIRDFRAPDGRPGRFQQHHLVYNKAMTGCPSGCGMAIRRLVTDRSSYFCPSCQRV